MSTDMPLERRLHDLYAVAVPTALDRRIEAAIATVPARPSSHGRRPRIAVLAIAAVIATAAAGPAVDWFAGWEDRYDRLWELSSPVDQSVTEGGYKVTVHRAYADPLGVRLAISVVDLDDRWSEIFVDAANMTDVDGRVYEGWNWSGARTPADATSAAWSRFVLPSEAPDQDLQLRVTVTSLAVRLPEPLDPGLDPERIWTSVAGDWTFEVDVPVVTKGNAIEPAVSASAGGVTVTLEELGLVPSGTLARLVVRGLPELPAGSDHGWHPVLATEHDGQPLTDDTFDPGVLADGDEILTEIVPVVDDLTGHWKITIFNFWSTSAGGQFGEPLGPWVLEFDVPVAS